jgi:hypothetical protein
MNLGANGISVLLSICNNFNHNTKIRIQIFNRDADKTMMNI